MKLTQSQIDQLYTFTQQHYVEYYDLQTELVDHLANAIEAKMQEQPSRTFDESLQTEFKKFGVFGFMEIVEERKAALHKKYNGLVWQHFKDFFSFPKVLLTVLLILAVFTLFKITNHKEIVLFSIFVALICFSIYKMIQTRRQQQKSRKQSSKKWLFEEIINQYGNFSATVFVPFNVIAQVNNHIQNVFTNDYYIWGLSIIVVLSSFFLFIIINIIPSKTQEYLIATYPEYKILSV